jgi:hypothetical protein
MMSLIDTCKIRETKSFANKNFYKIGKDYYIVLKVFYRIYLIC